MTEQDLARAVEILRASDSIASLTGAGVSAESGVPTFRGSDGLWEGHHIEDVATPDGFERDPYLVWKFYNARRTKLWTVKPNPGHFALAKMEQRWGADLFTLCTQNIDGLHQAAGSTSVLELHGSIARVRCTVCAYLEDRPNVDLDEMPLCPQCKERLRPDVVWFGEMLPEDVIALAGEKSRSCDCFLVIGTSAVVHPAAGLVDVAQSFGAKVIEVNPDETVATSRVDVSLRGRSGEVLPRLLEALEKE